MTECRTTIRLGKDLRGRKGDADTGGSSLTSSGVRRTGGWLLVVFGIAVAVLGFLGMSFYSPSLSEEELLRGALVGGLVLLIGVLMIIVGWLVLRADKKKEQGV